MLCTFWWHINLSSTQGTQSWAESCQVHQRGQHYPTLCCCNWCWNPRPHTRGTVSFSYTQLYYESSLHKHQNTGNANAHEGTQLWNSQVDSTVTVQFIWCQLILVLDSKFCWHCYCFRPKKGPERWLNGEEYVMLLLGSRIQLPALTSSPQLPSTLVPEDPKY